MITWQGPGVLYHKGRKFKAGDIIPAGIMSADRVSEFAHAGKVKVSESKELKQEPKKTAQQIKDDAKAKKEAEALAKKQAEDDEIARMIAEEEAKKAAGQA